MLSLLGLSFVTRDEEEELTPDQQDAVDAFLEKFYLWLSFSCAAVIMLGAGVIYVARSVGFLV